MLWNHLSYDLQCRVIDRIVDLLKDEESEEMVDGLMAAVHELEVWSNSPCTIVEADEQVVLDVEPDPFCEKGWED
jgi:hypothetical protein